MKTWFKNFPKVYTWVTIPMGILGWFTNLVPAIQGQVTIPQLVFGSLVVTLLIHTAIQVYRLKWGSGILSIFLSFVIILPIAPIMRAIYFPLLFRLVWLGYVLIFVYFIAYTITIAVNHAKNKKTSDDLNSLLKEKQKTKK